MRATAWRTLPARLDKADTQRERCRRWAQPDVWKRPFETVQEQEPDADWIVRNSTIVRAHAQAAGSRKKAASATRPPAAAAADEPRKSTPWWTHRVTRCACCPSQGAGCGRAGELLAAAAGTGNVLANKAYYTNQVGKLVAATGAGLVIPSKKNRLVEQVIDHSSYSDRNKVELFFSRLKQFWRLATRYDKTTSSFLGMLHFVSALLWLR